MRYIVLAVLALTPTVYSFGQTTETLKINWPEEYKWKVGSDQDNQAIHMIELIPENEEFENWTIMGTTMEIRGAKVAMEEIMNLMFNQTKQNAPDATLTLVEKQDDPKHPWIIYKIEAPRYKNSKTTESQLYYVIQGDSAVYANFVALKKKKFSEDFVAKWREVFKTSELVYQ